MTHRYIPESPPLDLGPLGEYLYRELLRVAATTDAIVDGEFDELHVEPGKPRHQLVFADGTNWNPGSGRGFYYFDEDANKWVRLNDMADFLIEVNKGNIAGHELYHKFGWRGNVTTTHHHLWNDPTANTDMIFPTVAETFDVITTGNDTAAGTGAREVFIEYLDTDFIYRTGVVATNAGTQASTFSAIRFIRAYATDCGTYGGTNENLITIAGTDSSNNYAFIEPVEGQTQNTQYCVPAGKTAYVLNISITTEANKAANLILHQRQNADVISAPFTAQRIVHQWDGIEVPDNEEFTANHKFPEKTDLWVGGDMVIGTGTLQFDYDILLVDNDL